MEITKGFEGINPKDFLEKSAILEISGIEENKRTSNKTQAKYVDYTLNLKGIDGEYKGHEFSIMYLFNRDLNSLIDSFGGESDTWIGKHVEVSAKKDGEYMRWVLKEANATVEKV